MPGHELSFGTGQTWPSCLLRMAVGRWLNSVSHSFDKYLLCNDQESGTGLRTGHTAVNKNTAVLTLREFTS